jgi:hypothetical protein
LDNVSVPVWFDQSPKLQDQPPCTGKQRIVFLGVFCLPVLYGLALVLKNSGICVDLKIAIKF